MFSIKEAVKNLPQKPGVYIMKNKDDEVIYVGKAVNLKNRVSQYFRDLKNHTPKVKTMVSHIESFEYIITDTEMEALILECNLIKKYRPKYNILLKDDKSYPYIKITSYEDFPKVISTRKFIKDKSKYYGPITDVKALKETLEIIYNIWPIRKCNRVLPRDIGKERPCLNYHIGKCLAPCDGKISKEKYQEMINEIIDFLDGRHEDIVKSLSEEMKEAASNLEFEKAAALRDKIKSIERVSEKQKMSNFGSSNCDVIAFAQKEENVSFQIFFMRGGKITGRETFSLNVSNALDESAILSDFIKQFYGGTAFIPREIIVSKEIDAKECELIENWLTAESGKKVSIVMPKKGEKRKLALLAEKNAFITLERFGLNEVIKERRTIKAVDEIKSALGLENNIVRIESYDISNTQGFESVGSMVVFENGEPKRSDYRKFKIKTVYGANDYASMKEVLARRFRRVLINKDEKFGRLPDLIMMDGGKTQINAAKEVLLNFNLDIPVCGMVKDDKHRTRAILFEDREIELQKNSEGFKLATRIQDEVHRFAIEYHRKLRSNNAVHSILDDIPGIGPARRKALLKHFGSIDKIKEADISELADIDGMNKASANEVYSFFRKYEG